MKKQFVFFDRKTILDFLRNYSNGPNSKDYEFIISIILSRVFEEMWNHPNVIGFELSEKYTRELPNLGNLDLKKVRNVLRRYAESDTPIDLAIAKGTVADHDKKGIAFQLKRFGKESHQKNTDALIEFLNKMPNKYSKEEITLVVILEPGIEFDNIKIRKSLVTSNYPFNRIMFMLATNKKLMVGEFWPNPGMNEYDPASLVNESNI